MGNVLQAGVGQAPARQAAIGAGIPDTVPAITLNKVCGSGLQGGRSPAAQAIALGDAEVVVAGGMESMSNAPYLSPQHARRRPAWATSSFKDAMILDGLWDVYDNVHMGICAEAVRGEPSRSAAPPRTSSRWSPPSRAIRAQKEGLFKAEIVPVPVPQKKGDPVMVAEDEGPKNAKPEKIPGLKPVFKKDGTVTAANASSINDGAAALVLMSAERAKAEGRTVLGRIAGYAQRRPQAGGVHHRPGGRHQQAARARPSSPPATWTSGRSTRPSRWWPSRTTSSSSWTRRKVNVRGGAVALGHPIGASGARVLVTLLHDDEGPGQEARRGVALHRRRRGHRADGRALTGQAHMNKVVAARTRRSRDIPDGAVMMSGGLRAVRQPREPHRRPPQEGREGPHHHLQQLRHHRAGAGRPAQGASR